MLATLGGGQGGTQNGCPSPAGHPEGPARLPLLGPIEIKASLATKINTDTLSALTTSVLALEKCLASTAIAQRMPLEDAL